VCHLRRSCERFGMISCACADRPDRDGPFFSEPKRGPAGPTTIDILPVRYFPMRPRLPE